MSYKLRLFCTLLIMAPSLAFSNTLIFAVDLIRHGDRTPVVILPSVNYQWPEGLGQLTAKGMQQEYKMGMEFRKRYIEQSHLLPERYEYGTMYVRSTDYHRTLMSAESLLMGLYPPGTGPNTSDDSLPALPNGFQPIPVFSAPSQYDDVIVKKDNDKEREKLMEQYVYSTKEWQQKNDELKNNYPIWSQATGLQIDSLEDLLLLGDTLYIHKLYNAPMPTGLSSKDIDTIIEAGNWVFMTQEKPKQIANKYSAQIMLRIANYLSNGRMEDSKLKYVLLSAHDLNIVSALSFLGAPLEKAPPYASDLNFSLYKEDMNSYTVKITYNNKPVFIPACGGSVCELEEFIKIVNNGQG